MRMTSTHLRAAARALPLVAFSLLLLALAPRAVFGQG